MNFMALKEVAFKSVKSMADKIPDFSKEAGKPNENNKIPEFYGKNLGYDIDIKKQNRCDAIKESSFLPESGGAWTGEKGNSTWIPDDDTTPKKHNPDGRTWGEIKADHDIAGINFKDGEPDFSEVSEATVEIEDFTEDRNKNFTQADEQCAKKWTAEKKDDREWTPSDVREYRKENNLSWHERSDQKTMDLVPSIVHGNIPHSGGISAAKKASQANG